MTDKKYELTEETTTVYSYPVYHTLYRIKATKDFGEYPFKVRKGDLGGFIEKKDNLSQDGNCWIGGDAMVYENAKVYDDAVVCGIAEVHNKSKVFEDALVNGKSHVYGETKIHGHSHVAGNASVYGYAKVYGNSKVFCDANISGNAEIFGNTEVFDNACVYDNVKIYEYSKVYETATILGKTIIRGNSEVCGYSSIKNAIIEESGNYMTFKNNWSSNRTFTWTKSNNMWSVGCFYGTGEQLIKKAYEDSEQSGRNYEKYVKFVEDFNKQ